MPVHKEYVHACHILQKKQEFKLFVTQRVLCFRSHVCFIKHVVRFRLPWHVVRFRLSVSAERCRRQRAVI